MDSKARNELDDIIRELNSIIGELESVSYGVRGEFEGIGNDRCADCINSVLQRYYEAKNKLENMDTTTLTENFAAEAGNGGGGSGGRGF